MTLRRPLSALLLGGLVLAVALSSGSAAGEESAPTQVDAPLTWLVGCWSGQEGRDVEQWSAGSGGYLFGHAQQVDAEGRARAFEHLRIEPGEQARAVYVAYPNGGPPTRFVESARTPTSVAFENREHDYPQRIEYVLESGTLRATISLADGSKAMHFVRRACSAP